MNSRTLRPFDEVTPTTTKRATVLALLDRADHDDQVVREARQLADRAGSTIALLYVAPLVLQSVPRGTLSAPPIEPWEQMRAIEGNTERHLRELARRNLRTGVRVRTHVRFGDPVEEAARLANSLGVDVVIAASQASWVPWRSRDRRLAQALDVPLVLVGGSEADRRRVSPRQATSSRA